MQKKLRFAQYGCGRMGKHTACYANDLGGELVAAFDHNPKAAGKSATEHFERDFGDVVISGSENIERVFAETKPDICIITTRSLMKDVEEVMMACANSGVNAVTTCEEAIFPWNSSPSITERIDRAAKAGNCTITGTGANETQYGGIFALYGGNTHKTDKIYAQALYNVDDYGVALARGHGVGLSPEEFEKEIASADNISDEERNELIENGEFLPSYVWNTNGWLCDYLGLTVKRQTQKCIPQYSGRDIESRTMQQIIPAGKAIGMSAVVTTETEEGIIIEAECRGIVYGRGEEDVNQSISYGIPDSNVTVTKPATVENTCATVVNRIPDVINAPAGFVTTSRMPALKYRVKDLALYCR